MGPGDAWEVERLRFTVRSAGLLVAGLVATVLTRNLFVAAHQPLGWAVASGLVALLLSPVVDGLSRVFPRPIAVAVTMLMLVILVSGVSLGLYADLRAEIGRLGEALPAAAADLEENQSTVGDLARDLHLEERVQAFVDDVERRSSERVALKGTVGTVPAYFVNGILVVFFVIWGPRMFAGALRQIAGAERRARVEQVVTSGVQAGRGYMLAVLAQALVAGVVTALAFWGLDLPSPAVLGGIVGLMSLVPYVGILFAGVLPLLLCAGLQPAWVTSAMAIGVVALQLLGVLVQEHVHRRWLRVGPAAIVVAAMVGSAAYGLGGAVYGTAAAMLGVALLDAASAELETHGPAHPAAHGPAPPPS